MLGWSVTGFLALSAGVLRGAHPLSAATAAARLGITSLLCAYCILRREFRGVPGYDPSVLLQDKSGSEYEAVVSLAKGYQTSIDLNAAGFRRLKALLAIAILFMAAAPLAGLVVLMLWPYRPMPVAPDLIPIRVALALAEYPAAFRPAAREFLLQRS